MNRPIFFLINSLQNGGAERVVSTLAERFHERKFEVCIICQNHSDNGFKIPPDLKVIHLTRRTKDNFFFRIYYGMLTLIRLTYLVAAKRPQCVIAFMTTANLWAGISCFLARTKYIVSERTTPDHTINTFSGFLKWVAFFVYRNAKAIVVPSQGIADCLKRHRGYDALTNYRVIKNPVKNTGELSGVGVNDKPFILGVGRLSYEKGFDQLIAAFQKSKAHRNGTDLVIAGEGVEREALAKQIRSLNLQQSVKLVGLKKNLLDYYSQAELFVLPSRNEGYPNALLEAMSMGCSCIAMNCEFGPSEIIKHRKNGLLVEDKNIDKLSKAISKLLGDPALKQKLAYNARYIKQTNSLEAICTQWEELIFS